MKEITKPLVSIVMAVYNPKLNWFVEQLKSINNQTYKSIEIIVIDDCSTRVDFYKIKKCILKYITKFPVNIIRNDKNLGSNKTFEKLTIKASGKYIAYCDQDDIWNKNKIEAYVDKIENSTADLVFSDMNIIDGKGKFIADSITKVRKYHVFSSGRGLTPILLFSNFVAGCAMMIKSDIAKKAIPFCPYMVHDHWLALFTSREGELLFINEQLINYRIHDSNQTLMMAGVYDKETYLKQRIEVPIYKMFWLKEFFKCNEELNKLIDEHLEWLIARYKNLYGCYRNLSNIWKYRKFGYNTSIFEIFAPYMPHKIFNFVIDLKKKNIL